MERLEGFGDNSSHIMVILPFFVDGVFAAASFSLAFPYDGGGMCRKEGDGIPGTV